MVESCYCYRCSTVITGLSATYEGQGTAAAISKIVADGLLASGECLGSLMHSTAAGVGARDMVGAAGMHSARASASGRTSAAEDARNWGDR